MLHNVAVNTLAPHPNPLPISLRSWGEGTYIPRLFLRVISGRSVDPILPLRRENIDVDRIFEKMKFVRHVGRDDHKTASAKQIFLALRINFAGTFGDPGDLLVGVMMQR